MEIRTPALPASPRINGPRINGPRVYGQRAGRPFLYAIPTTGVAPIAFTATGLPQGLRLDGELGLITGLAERDGVYPVHLTAANSFGTTTTPLRIKIGDQLCLTPPMGWNSWNCFAATVDQEKVCSAAAALKRTGLSGHGWSYITIDDGWQGRRDGPEGSLQPNEKFPDAQGLCTHLHALGLKAGIYSTPWQKSYAGYPGGEDSAHVDARQWAQWGFDYLKYDWNPIDLPNARRMADALRHSGRDMAYSLSNSAALDLAADYAQLANCWRTTGDIIDTWESVSGIGFWQEHWTPFAGPGHWNDPDMLVVGRLGWGHLRPTRLTPDEQYLHITLWCLLSAPLLLGCDLHDLDDFTLGLLTNDEVLAVNQDELGRPATPIARQDGREIWARPLADGAWAVGFFNRRESGDQVTLNLADLKLDGPQPVRDLWRQKDWDPRQRQVTAYVAAHSAELFKIGSPL